MFAAVGQHDTKKEAETLATKILRIKMWDGEDGSKVCLVSSPLDVVLWCIVVTTNRLQKTDACDNFSGNAMCKTSLAKCSVVHLHASLHPLAFPSFPLDILLHLARSSLFQLISPPSPFPSGANHQRSIPIHSVRCDTQRHQARLSPVGTPGVCTRALRAFREQSPSWVPGGAGTRWRVSGNDGCSAD